MHLHGIVKIDAAAFSAVHWCPVSEVRELSRSHRRELRKQKGTSKETILVPLVDLKFLDDLAAGSIGTSNRRH